MTSPDSRSAWTIGGLWLAMTLIFETGVGLFLAGLSWKEIAVQYNIITGNLWLLIPVWTFIGPYVFFRLQRPTLPGN